MTKAQNVHARKQFTVVHPLHDKPEQKLQTEGLGPIAMTTGVRISLLVLRVYLILMTLMLVYHVGDLAGIVGKH
jgi:hypothetical protein